MIGVMNKNVIIAVAVIVFLLGGFLFFSLGSDRPELSDWGEGRIEDVEKGDGQVVSEGDRVVIHYEGALEDGTVFSSSIKRGNPTRFTVGSGSVITGWEEGVLGMKEGGIRRLVIPPELGYGSKERGSIPANSTLVYEIRLLEIESRPE